MLMASYYAKKAYCEILEITFSPLRFWLKFAAELTVLITVLITAILFSI